MTINPQTIYHYLLSKGVSPQAAAGILANIKAESNFRSDVLGDGRTSGGLFQHHASRFSALKSYAARRGRPWTDWKTQVDFALKEAAELGADLRSTNAYEFSYWWTVKFERPKDMHRRAVERLDYVPTYAYGADLGDRPAYPSYGGSPGDGGVAPPEDAQLAGVPQGMEVVKVGETYYLVGEVSGGQGASAFLYFSTNTAPPGAVTSTMTQAEWDERVVSDQMVNGGSALELNEFGGDSWDEIVTTFLYESGLYGSDALSDQGVMNAVAAYIGAGDMSETEFMARLRVTDWWKEHTDRQRTWNDKSPAQQEQEIMEQAGKLVGLWFTYVGEDIDFMEYDANGDGIVTSAELKAGNPEFYEKAVAIASGELTQTQVTNTWIKDAARENPDSPFMRSLREEEKAQGQHQMDVDATAGDIVEMYQRWGLPMSFEAAKSMAEKVVMNQVSMEEVLEDVKDQAMGLYPTKARDIDTTTWASPYIQTQSMLLETSEPGLMDDRLQKALTSGMSLADFRKEIKKSDEWKKTKNARDEYISRFAEVGRMMGYV